MVSTALAWPDRMGWDGMAGVSSSSVVGVVCTVSVISIEGSANTPGRRLLSGSRLLSRISPEVTKDAGCRRLAIIRGFTKLIAMLNDDKYFARIRRTREASRLLEM